MTSEFVSKTVSVCPVCLEKIGAEYRRHASGDVYLEKTCQIHGAFSTVVWRGTPSFDDWHSLKGQEGNSAPVQADCPQACAVCDSHMHLPCCVLLEVTDRCNFLCPICYASSGSKNKADPSLAEIKRWYERLMAAGGPFNIQLSGGEPTVREDLPEIIRIGRSLGFPFFQLNTNGILIAQQAGYLESLVEAGLSVVYLQFDGTEDAIYRTIRGRDLIEVKQRAVERCAEAGIGVVLVPTVVPGVNDGNLGNILRFALARVPVVRGIHIQPICYMGRFGEQPDNAQRITLPEVIHRLVDQSGGLLQEDEFKPCTVQHARCGFQSNYLVDASGELTPSSAPESACSCKTGGDPSQKRRQFVARNWTLNPEKEEPIDSNPFSAWEDYLKERQRRQFTLSGMAFQDSWTLDIDRLQRCCIMIANREGKPIPFCAYNLTGMDGTALYR